MLKKEDTSIKIFGMDLFSRPKKELLKQISSHFDNSTKLSYIFTPNPEQVVQAHQNTQEGKQFLADLQVADWLVPDGVGLVWASKLLEKRGEISTALSERIAGADLVSDILSLLAARSVELSQKQTVLIIGGQGYEQTALQGLEEQLRYQYPGARIALHWVYGYDTVRVPTKREEAAVLEALQSFRPNVVFAAFGAPQQERWLVSHQSVLSDAGVELAMAVGGSFDYLLGKVARAPKMLRKMGLEWLFRLAIQPWRITRQLRLIAFVVQVGTGKLK